ncbi:tetratricopeptide repeat protein [uncultured Desulfobacter sp.]|uniref:tetratricopeptide repeat protein n=1 Tax=uncultured Desulfobacter sp. TaxID=240139 RepID=UPI0029C906D8|nr:tetratricopeptide repeat protein [uncultured Desulfobacter sp.]
MKIFKIKSWCFNTNWKHFFFVFFLFLMMLPNSVFGRMNKGWGILPDEMAAVPRWCRCKMQVHKRHYTDIPAPLMQEYNKWGKIIGEDTLRAAHHYCMALNWINRYKRSLSSSYKDVDMDRKFALKQGLDELRFMKSMKTIKKRALYYRLLMNEAYLYRELGDFEKAARNYREIMSRKPGYASAYIEYAQLLHSFGNNADAVKILQIGLKRTKGNKIIQQMMTNIRGEGEHQ